MAPFIQKSNQQLPLQQVRSPGKASLFQGPCHSKAFMFVHSTRNTRCSSESLSNPGFALQTSFSWRKQLFHVFALMRYWLSSSHLTFCFLLPNRLLYTHKTRHLLFWLENVPVTLQPFDAQELCCWPPNSSKMKATCWLSPPSQERALLYPPARKKGTGTSWVKQMAFGYISCKRFSKADKSFLLFHVAHFVTFLAPSSCLQHSSTI